MKAMVIREFGPPEVMRLEEVPTPEPGPGEVLVEIHAVSVNRTLDLIVRAGKYPRPVRLPHVLGVDPSGVVVKLGPGVTTRKVGDRVTSYLLVSPKNAKGPPDMLGLSVWGGYAQYVCLPAAVTYLIPDALDFATATVVARHAPLAFSMLRDKAKVARGDWVLVMGAAGGLGSVAVQAAKYLGARVIAAAGADERVQAALDLGADAGINYRSADLTAEVKRITGGSADIVLENIGDPDLFAKAFASLGRGGRMVTAGAHGGGTVPLNVSHLYVNNITIMGWTGQSDEDVVDSLGAAAEGRLRVLIDRVMPLADAVEAHHIVAARGGLGKVILEPAVG
jgi:NADPH:quinone reductase-like Zn-dependent oxidoreductase